MKRVLIVCADNTCQSQMAEGYLNFFAAHLAEVESAGLWPGLLKPEVVEVMHEDNIDISAHQPKTIADLSDRTFDYLITLIDDHSDISTELGINCHTQLKFYIPSPDQYGHDFEALRQTRESVKKAFLHFIGQHLIVRQEVAWA